MKHYITDTIDRGQDTDGFISAMADIADQLPGLTWGATDGREDQTTTDGPMWVQCDPTPAQHALIIADSRVEYLVET